MIGLSTLKIPLRFSRGCWYAVRFIAKFKRRAVNLPVLIFSILILFFLHFFWYFLVFLNVSRPCNESLAEMVDFGFLVACHEVNQSLNL